jgi:hypothetical protein
VVGVLELEHVAAVACEQVEAVRGAARRVELAVDARVGAPSGVVEVEEPPGAEQAARAGPLRDLEGDELELTAPPCSLSQALKR